MPKPRSGESLAEEIHEWSEAGIHTIVSLLDPVEERMLELGEEKTLCECQGLEFLSFPISDRGVPDSLAETRTFVDSLVTRLSAGKGVAIHCRVGIGRSGLITACVLVRLGLPYDEVFEVLSRARGMQVPDTPEQALWVRGFARDS